MKTVSVHLPGRLIEELDDLVEEEIFGSRSDAIRFGARLAVMFKKKRLYQLSEDYAYEEITKGTERGRMG